MIFPSSNISYTSDSANEDFDQVGVRCSYTVKAIQYKNTPCIGRTHGIHADITSFGLKWALWYEEMKRNLSRWDNMSYSTFENHVKKVKSFAKERNAYIIKEAKAYFNLSNSEVNKYFGGVK